MWYNWYQDHPEEWVRRLELQYRDLQLFESCQADEVQRCTTIDKDMVQLDVDDGWGDEQRELPGPCVTPRVSKPHYYANHMFMRLSVDQIRNLESNLKLQFLE
jgi:hypothetical protein